MKQRRPDDSYRPAARAHPGHAEGPLTRVIEERTAQIPSVVFLWAGLSAMIASALLELADRPRASRFVGMWAPTLLVAGVYNKLVKTLGTS